MGIFDWVYGRFGGRSCAGSQVDCRGFAVGLPDGLQGFCMGFAVSSWAWSLSMIPGVDSWAVSSSRADDGCGGGALACHRKNHPPKKSQRTKANICWRGLCPGIDLAGRWRWSLAALAPMIRAWIRGRCHRQELMTVAAVMHPPPAGCTPWVSKGLLKWGSPNGVTASP